MSKQVTCMFQTPNSTPFFLACILPYVDGYNCLLIFIFNFPRKPRWWQYWSDEATYGWNYIFFIQIWTHSFKKWQIIYIYTIWGWGNEKLCSMISYNSVNWIMNFDDWFPTKWTSAWILKNCNFHLEEIMPPIWSFLRWTMHSNTLTSFIICHVVQHIVCEVVWWCA